MGAHEGMYDVNKDLNSVLLTRDEHDLCFAVIKDNARA
jgi:hypothetical protein